MGSDCHSREKENAPHSDGFASSRLRHCRSSTVFFFFLSLLCQNRFLPSSHSTVEASPQIFHPHCFNFAGFNRSAQPISVSWVDYGAGFALLVFRNSSSPAGGILKHKLQKFSSRHTNGGILKHKFSGRDSSTNGGPSKFN